MALLLTPAALTLPALTPAALTLMALLPAALTLMALMPQLMCELTLRALPRALLLRAERLWPCWQVRWGASR